MDGNISASRLRAAWETALARLDAQGYALDPHLLCAGTPVDGEAFAEGLSQIFGLVARHWSSRHFETPAELDPERALYLQGVIALAFWSGLEVNAGAQGLQG